jgi:hypothetical protein
MPNKKFKGTSNKGDFQEALTKAVDKALTSVPGADIQIKWTMVYVNGEKGGLKPKNSITVTIDAALP